MAALTSNPLDKVYGLLGMARRDPDAPDGGLPVPDYRLDAAAVYQQVSELFLARHTRFSIIAPAGRRDTHEGRTPGLPSWVIDWHYEQVGHLTLDADLEDEYRRPTKDPDASRTDLYPKVFSVEGKTLRVRGVVLDEIVAQAFPFSFHDGEAPGRGLSFAQSVIYFMGGWDAVARVWSYHDGTRSRKTTDDEATNEATYPFTGESLTDVFIRTVTAGDAISEATLPRDRRRPWLGGILKMASMVAWLTRSPLFRIPRLRGPSLDVLGLFLNWYMPRTGSESLIGLLLSKCAEKLYFRTRRGYMGASYRTKWGRAGDRIVIPRGCACPWILRPLDDGNWMFIGETYVHGIMKGEAFDLDKCVDICIV